VSEGIFPPFDVTEVFATDADSGDNGDVGYEMIGYEPDVDNGQLFKIDPVSGLIRCHKELDRETLDRYVIKASLVSETRVARWFVFKPKIQIWVNFGRSCNGRCWYILWTLGPFYSLIVIFHGHLV
jgi:hypothetical protein